MADRQTKCVVCREPISCGAAKCIHCDSYQGRGWRLWFGWSGTVAAGLALLPVWGIGVSLWHIAFPPAAHVELRSSECSRDTITIIVANDGSKAVLLGSPEMVVLDGGVERSSGLSLQAVDGEQVHPVLEPNEVVLVDYAAQLNREPAPLPTGVGCDLRVTIPAFAADGNEPLSFECPCASR